MKPCFKFPSTMHRRTDVGGIFRKEDVRSLLPLHPAQKWGDASDAMLKAVWDKDAKRVEALPPVSGLNDDDWVYLHGRDTIHSALWEALCNIIVPRRRMDRLRGGVGVNEHALLRTLLQRRPGGANGLLRGCLRIQRESNRDATWETQNGGPRRSLTPIAATLALCECSCTVGPWSEEEEDPFKRRRARACLRVLLNAGARLQPCDAYYVARACRKKAFFAQTMPCIRLLLEHGELETKLEDVSARPHVRAVLDWLRKNPAEAPGMFDNDRGDAGFEGDDKDVYFTKSDEEEEEDEDDW
jgi:hypothetical protein